MPESSEKRGSRRILVALLWLVTILEAVTMGLSGVAKFLGPTWVVMFQGWGYAGWFTYVIGAAEAAGAALVLVPRTASYAAVMLTMIMLGAIWTELTNESGLGLMMPTIHIAVLAIILLARWKQRW